MALKQELNGVQFEGVHDEAGAEMVWGGGLKQPGKLQLIL